MFKLGFAFCVGLLCGACGDYSNQVLEQDLAFLNAVPSKTSLELRIAENKPRCEDCRVQALEIAQFGLGQVAHYFLFAVKIIHDVNLSIFGFLEMVDWITHNLPPSYRTQDRRDWGPYRWDENQDVEVRFLMRKESTSQYGLHFQMRWSKAGQATDEDWKDCVSGWVIPMIGVRRGEGQLVINLDNCSEYNAMGERGRALVEYDTTPDADNPTGKTQLKIQFTDFVGKEEADDDSTPLNALYDYSEASDYSGRFEFSGWQDIVMNNPLLPQPEHYEMLVVWNNERAGTAQVTLSQGDLGDQSFEVDECWDESFFRIYYKESHLPNTEQGDPSDCIEW